MRRCPIDTFMNNDTVVNPISGRLGYLGLIRFAGADRFSFLQGQISHDSSRLAAGRPLLAAYSSPQGRVLAVLRLLPHESGVIGILPRELVMPTLERMRKFVLRAKVTIEDASEELLVAGRHGEAALQAAGLPVPDSATGYAQAAGVAVALAGAHSRRFWLVAARDRLAALGLGGDALDAPRIESDWRLADIRGGLPQVYAPTREVFVAQMLNLDLIDGISFSKGCYTGQEIIARAQNLGRIKRRMMRLAVTQEGLKVGDTIRTADGRTGRLSELARANGAFEALAVLNLAAASDSGDPPEAAATATELPLPYRL